MRHYRPVALGTVTFVVAGLAVLVPGAPARADVTLTVDATTMNADCSIATCTLQAALTFAGTQAGVVTVSVAPGLYTPPSGSGGFIVPAGSEDKLIIRGSGSENSPAATILHTGDDGSGGGWGIDIANTVDFPVGVHNLRITTIDSPRPAPNPTGLFGINNLGAAALSVTDVVLDSLHGASGSSGANCSGGSVTGVASGTPDLRITGSTISNLTGGAAALGACPEAGAATGVFASPAQRAVLADTTIAHVNGGGGGDEAGQALGIDLDGPSRMTLTRLQVSDLRGGASRSGAPVGGGRGVGGSALGILLNAFSSAKVTDTEVRGLTGGAGGDGDSASGNGDPGADGGAALGAQMIGNSLSVRGSTMAEITGGNGGSGGPSTGGGQPGTGGAAGSSRGLFAGFNGGTAPTIVDSTVTTVTGGIPGGAADRSSSTGVVMRPNGGALTHVTVTGARFGLDLIGVTLTASLLENDTNCAPGSTVTDGGYNVASSDGNSCGLGATSDFTHTFAPGELAPLANYGGPTDTVALAPSSSAARQVPVSSGLCAGNDQRGPGFPRPGVGAPTACAAGAFEPQPGGAPSRPGPVHNPGNPGNPADRRDPCGAITTRAYCPA